MTEIILTLLFELLINITGSLMLWTIGGFRGSLFTMIKNSANGINRQSLKLVLAAVSFWIIFFTIMKFAQSALLNFKA